MTLKGISFVHCDPVLFINAHMTIDHITLTMVAEKEKAKCKHWNKIAKYEKIK